MSPPTSTEANAWVLPLPAGSSGLPADAPISPTAWGLAQVPANPSCCALRPLQIR
jgi:hypothetical protein